MHKYKAIVFDLDGTLLDTLEDLAVSMNSVLVRNNYPIHGKDAYRYFVGDGIEKLVQRVLPPNQRKKKIIAACVAEMHETYDKRWAETTQLYSGIADLLTGLTREKVRLAILSNKPDDFTKIMVDHYLSHWTFEIVMGATADHPKKPDPYGAIKIATKMNLSPSCFLYIGDTNTDMHTATKAGMHAIGAGWGFRTPEELMNSGAQIVINKPGDLLTLFKKG
jgi:phosphoglycolate phosphatase